MERFPLNRQESSFRTSLGFLQCWIWLRWSAIAEGESTCHAEDAKAHAIAEVKAQAIAEASDPLTIQESLILKR